MELQSLYLNGKSFIWINCGLVFLSFAANIFYAYCLMFPLHRRQRLKQPLRILLECLVWCSIMYCLSLPMWHGLLSETETFDMTLFVFVLSFTYYSMTSSGWLNFFFCMQIVPHKHAVLVWIKRNIRPVIYVALLFDGTQILLNSVMNMVFMATAFTYINGTNDYAFPDLYISNTVVVVVSRVHILVCLCVMTFSSFCTTRYLLRHMRNMAESGNSFHTERIKSHKRVTIAGISQGLVYFLYGTFYVIDTYTTMFAMHVSVSYRVYFTVTSVYIFGTTVNLGIGQALFRKRAADVWMALKTLGPMVSNGMRLHSSQVMSDEIVTVTGQMTL